MTPQRFLLNPTPDEMPQTADVVVIGGGPAGTAAVWAIERLAPGTKTVLIEKSERLGAGSSLASLENFRTCWPALCLARQMQRSVEILHHADEYLGEGAAQSIALKTRGYLFCAFTEQQAAGLASDVRRLHEIGLNHIEYLNAAEVASRFGWVGERVIAAKYDPTAGWLDSNALIHRSEAREGAIFGWEYNWNNKYAEGNHGTNDAHDAILDPVDPVSDLKDPRFPSIALTLLARQFGHQPGQGFADSRYLRGISHNIGYYVYRDESAAYRTDSDGVKHPYDSERAIIDSSPEVEGLYMSVAHVGHGIMSSPAAGEILAAKVLGQPPLDPIFDQFGLNTPWVDYDEGVL